MFDIAWSEFLVVAVVALVVVGPKDLPPLLRTIGKMMAQVRRMAGEFQTQFNEAMREAELDDLQKEVTGLRDSAKKFMSAPDPLTIARDEIKGAIEGKPSALAGKASDAAMDAPSAIAPQPEPAPIPEAPEPTAKDFEPSAAKANGAAHPAAGEPESAPEASKEGRTS